MDEVRIRELLGFAEVRTVYQLTRQNSSLSQALFDDRMGLMLAQGNYRCIAAYDLSPKFPPVLGRVRLLMFGPMRPAFPVPFGRRTRWG